MELLTITVAIVTIAEKLFNIKDKFRSKGECETPDLSIILNSIGDLLSSVAKGLRTGVYPHSKCAQLEYTMHKMLSKLTPYMEKDELQNLERLIQTAYQVERLFGESASLSNENKELNIRSIESAAGKFYAAAAFANI